MPEIHPAAVPAPHTSSVAPEPLPAPSKSSVHEPKSGEQWEKDKAKAKVSIRSYSSLID